MVGYNAKEALLEEKEFNLGAVYTPELLSEYSAHLLFNLQKNIWKKEAEETYTEETTERNEHKKLLYVLNKCMNWRVVDPACGNASLLKSLETYIINYINELKRELPTTDYIDFDISRLCPYSVTTYAIDISSTAILDAKRELSKLNMRSVSRKADFIWADSLIPFTGYNKLHAWQKLLPDVFEKGGFEAVIANPPWGADLQFNAENYNNSGYSLANGQYDSYELFIELCIDLVAEGSPLLFIIPDSIFLPEHKKLRQFLLKNTEIHLVARLGEKLFPNVFRSCSIILLVKKNPSDSFVTKCFRLNHTWREQILSGLCTFLDAENVLSHYVSQLRFKHEKNNNFDIDIKDEETEIIAKIENNPINWDKLFNNARGVEISKKGSIVQCPTCLNWQASPRYGQILKCNTCKEESHLSQCASDIIISNKNNHQDWACIIAGEDLKRYQITLSKSIKLNLKGIQYKDKNIYSSPKIIIRKTGLGINASIDYDGNYTTQTVYHYYLKYGVDSNRHPLEYFLGVLNSRVMFYYYIKKYGENEWKSHPYITQKIISTLPIPDISKNNNKTVLAIADLVKEKINEGDKDFKIDYQIEALVAGLYGLTKEQLWEIIKYINKFQDLSAINEMKIKHYMDLIPKTNI